MTKIESPTNVQCFGEDNNWGAGAGMAQVKMGSSSLVLIQEVTGGVLPIVTSGDSSSTLQYHWRKFVWDGKYSKDLSIHDNLRNFVEFVSNQ